MSFIERTTESVEFLSPVLRGVDSEVRRAVRGQEEASGVRLMAS